MKKLRKKMVVILMITILCVSFASVVNAKEIEGRKIGRTYKSLEDLYLISFINKSSILLNKIDDYKKDFLDIAKVDTIAWIEEFKNMRENEENYEEALEMYDETFKSCEIEANESNTAKLLETIVYNINKGYPTLIKVKSSKSTDRNHNYLIIYGYKESIYETSPFEQEKDPGSIIVNSTLKSLSTTEKVNVTFDDLKVYDVYSGIETQSSSRGVHYIYLSDYVDSYTDICVKGDGSFFVDLYAGNNDKCLYIDNDITTQYTEENKEEVIEEKVEEIEKNEVVERVEEIKTENVNTESFIMKIINQIISFIKNLIGNLFKI